MILTFKRGHACCSDALSQGMALTQKRMQASWRRAASRL